jgi:2-polyprenyl-3-methyl-5-hydroxy-6-metoxy-1,4-benzoquinol methylase
MTDRSWRELNDETKDIWDRNAAFWDDYMGEGNDFQRLLVGPATEKLLELQGGELILDIACGNGNFSRRLAQLGAQVVAFDFSPTFIERARANSSEYIDQIEYHVIDATHKEQLLTLGQARFDAAVCNMALMDMPEIVPLIDALPKMLKPAGCFIFSVMHPCFNSIGANKVIEEIYRNGDLVSCPAIKISTYITPATSKGLGVIGQPLPQNYFHRPLSVLFEPCFQAGFVLDRLEEPVFNSPEQGSHLFSWLNFKEIPPVLTVRFRSIE